MEFTIVYQIFESHPPARPPKPTEPIGTPLGSCRGENASSPGFWPQGGPTRRGSSVGLSTAGDSVHMHRREGYPDPLETDAPPSSSPPCSPLAWLCRRRPLAASWRRAR